MCLRHTEEFIASPSHWLGTSPVDVENVAMGVGKIETSGEGVDVVGYNAVRNSRRGVRSISSDIVNNALKLPDRGSVERECLIDWLEMCRRLSYTSLLLH